MTDLWPSDVHRAVEETAIRQTVTPVVIQGVCGKRHEETIQGSLTVYTQALQGGESGLLAVLAVS